MFIIFLTFCLNLKSIRFTASVHTAPEENTGEKQLRRSISEFNVHQAATGGRRHLYSLCLQRIMLVEFELLAHQEKPQGKKCMHNY